jgi:hypothetical protein
MIKLFSLSVLSIDCISIFDRSQIYMAKILNYPQKTNLEHRNAFTKPLYIYALILLSLSACSTTTPPPVAETNKPSEKTIETSRAGLVNAQPSSANEAIVARKASAEHCSVVDEKSVRSSCFHYAPSGHAEHGRMCQPQSIPYARCRSQISSCNLGNTSPVELFNCEQRLGYTSSTPQPGALMSIGVNQQHHMSTGHTLYVEEVCPNPDGTYKLRVSHTNYDRQCHLEEDVWVHYDPHHKYADFSTGHWAAWGKHLPIQGFILQEPSKGEGANSSLEASTRAVIPPSASPKTHKKSGASTSKITKAKKKSSPKQH